jgi:hypothetical protein
MDQSSFDTGRCVPQLAHCPQDLLYVSELTPTPSVN